MRDNSKNHNPFVAHRFQSLAVGVGGSGRFNLAVGTSTVLFEGKSFGEVFLTANGLATTNFLSLVAYSADMTANGVATVNFETSADVVAPVINATLDAENNEVDVTLTELNYPVTMYWQVRAIATVAPTQGEMLAGSGALLNDTYTINSIPHSEPLAIGTLTDTFEYTLYQLAADPSLNYSAIEDIDFTYNEPSSVSLSASGIATVTFTIKSSIERNLSVAGSTTVTFIGETTADWMIGLQVIDGGTASTTTNDAVDGGTAATSTNDLIGGELAA